jgi:hypothetical protein
MKIYRMNSYRKTGTSSFSGRRRAGIPALKKAAGGEDMITLSAEAMMNFHLERKSGIRARQEQELRDRAARRLVYDMTSGADGREEEILERETAGAGERGDILAMTALMLARKLLA